ncbi:putative zinc-binding protein [Paracoccus simplex]|uniref:Zinc-binding protein n=1 Tax=Paracoccus simplex TaxID=2086346 RepID=A0ABV7S5H5_9RHOB
MNPPAQLPLVYSCSGCSSAAQMANYLAVQMDRRGLAQMSCIAGVGGDVPKLVRLATSGRRIIAIDGCALACVRNCLARHGVQASDYHLLSDHGVRKRYQTDFDTDEAERVLSELAERLDAPARSQVTA